MEYFWEAINQVSEVRVRASKGVKRFEYAHFQTIWDNYGDSIELTKTASNPDEHENYLSFNNFLDVASKCALSVEDYPPKSETYEHLAANKDEFNAIFKVFHEIDSDKDGKISVSELEQMFENMGKNIDQVMFNRLLEKVDLNHDKHLQ